jgi:hypothetical protein
MSREYFLEGNLLLLHFTKSETMLSIKFRERIYRHMPERNKYEQYSSGNEL